MSNPKTGRNSEKTVFKRLLINLLCVFVLMISVSIFIVYKHFNTIFKQEIHNSNLEILEQTSKIVEVVLKDIETMALSLGVDNDIYKSIGLAYDSKESEALKTEIVKKLSNRAVSSSYIHSIYFYPEQKDYVITDSGIIMKQFFLNDKVISELNNKSVTTAWISSWDLKESRSKSEKVFSYIMKVPLENSKGLLVVNIKVDLFYKAVIVSNKWKFNHLVIVDDNQIILSSSNSQKAQLNLDNYMLTNTKGYLLENDGFLISYISSEYNKWRYIAYTDLKVVYQYTQKIMTSMLVIFTSFFIIGVLLSVAISKNFYKPIKSLTAIFEPHKGNVAEKRDFIFKNDEFGYLNHKLTELLNENEDFRITFANNEERMKEHFLLNLVTGRNKNSTDINNKLKYYKIALESKNIFVMVYNFSYINISEETNVHKNMLSFKICNMVQEILDQEYNGVSIDIDRNHIAVIINYTDRDGSAKEISKELYKRIKDQIPLHISCGIGNCYESISDVSLSYNEAMHALSYKKISSPDSIISIQDVMKKNQSIKSILLVENKKSDFITELKLGSRDKAISIFENLYNQLCLNDSISLQQRNTLFNEIINALIYSVVDTNNYEEVFGENFNPYYEYLNLTSVLEVKNWFIDLIDKVTGYNTNRRNNKNIEIVEFVKKYIDTHYMEPITLQEMADMVYLSSSYFSSLFKEIAGINLKQYLVEVRLREACKKLVNTNLTIESISEIVGFGDKQNFIRTFKKVHKMTPSEYRKKIRSIG